MIELVALPTKEAIEYFRQKGFAIGFDHQDVWQAQHQVSFTVAKVMQQDILEDIRQAVDAALVDVYDPAAVYQSADADLRGKGMVGAQANDRPAHRRGQ